MDRRQRLRHPCAGLATAQGIDDSLGSRSRADAARNLIVLAVQQGISSLPPTSGQSFIYEFDLSQGTWVPTERMNPTSFRVPQTIGSGVFSLRAAASYFDLSDSFGPATYAVALDDGRRGFTKFGLDVSARVGLLTSPRATASTMCGS